MLGLLKSFLRVSMTLAHFVGDGKCLLSFASADVEIMGLGSVRGNSDWEKDPDECRKGWDQELGGMFALANMRVVPPSLKKKKSEESN